MRNNRERTVLETGSPAPQDALAVHSCPMRVAKGHVHHVDTLQPTQLVGNGH
jgi:hypothetical protein